MCLHSSYSRFCALLLAGMALASPAAAKKEGYVTTGDGVRLYYVEQGAGPDVVVAPVAFHLAPHLLGPLSAKRRVIFYDPRNRGRSGAAPLERVSLDRQIADLEELRSSLGIEKMALIGWSSLGMEMAVYALRHPDRVTRLVQMSPVPPAASIMREAGGDTRGEKVDRAALEALDKRAQEGAFTDDPAEYCRLRTALTLPGNFADPAFTGEVPDVCVHENEWPNDLWRYFGKLIPSFGDYDWREDLKKATIPRLIIHCREDGIPLKGAQAWAAGYKQAQLLVLSPCGHFPFIEQRAATLAAIDTFLGGSWPEGARAVTAGGN